ncbi:MAG TPA: hypothetical protein VHK86_03865 [Nitrososphaera sp.]|nr:hypothetical protein [Nitrososphaera sp.]HEX2615017.1 hypothetical protein [Nitrososphaera sp.]
MSIIKYGLRLSSITIDADGSPSGYIAWYNHSTETSRIRTLRPSVKNDRYGVQRMEMLAIYFALADNQRQISRIANNQKKKQLVVNIRSDSKTSVEQLQGISEVRDAMLQRICMAIRNLIERVAYMTIFNHLERARNIAGLLLEQRRRKEEEKLIMHRYEKYYGSLDRLQGLMTSPYELTTA